MPKPSFSVVMPLYNHERFVRRALESVLNQTRPVDEIIVVDDGSTDEGLAIAREVLAGVDRATILTQPNRGAHEALNRGVRLSRSEYVAVINSDDMFAGDKIALCEALIRPTAKPVLISGRIELIDDSDAPIQSGPVRGWLDHAMAFYEADRHLPLAILHENLVATTSNMVFSRELWAQLGGFRPLRYCHDMDFLLDAFGRGPVIFDETQIHIGYRIHEKNTVTESNNRLGLEIAAVLAAHLSQEGGRFLTGPTRQARAERLLRVVRNREASDVIVVLMMLFREFPNRAAFYEGVLEMDVAGRG